MAKKLKAKRAPQRNVVCEQTPTYFAKVSQHLTNLLRSPYIHNGRAGVNLQFLAMHIWIERVARQDYRAL